MALFDQTSFAKFTLRGPGALASLNWMCANDVDKPVGSLTYTQMLDDRGGIQCDLTVCRTDDDAFYLVTGTGFAVHDLDWVARSIPAHGSVEIADVTTSSTVLSLMGPNSRNVLEAVTSDDVSGRAFPFGTMRPITIAGASVKALRITYVGELGWELHTSTHDAAAVYDALVTAGKAHGLVNAGYRAIESCRLEKGYRAWGADIGPDHSPVEAGLGWAVKQGSGVEFRGQAAIARQRAEGVKKMLATFTIDPEAVGRDVVLLGRETIYRDGERVGWLSSGGFGYTVGRSIGMGYVRHPQGVTAAWLLAGTYELDVATERYRAAVSLRPLYDPTSARVKA